MVAAMKTDEAVAKLAEVIRRKHLALKTEQSDCAWLRRYCQHIAMLPAHLPANRSSNSF